MRSRIPSQPALALLLLLGPSGLLTACIHVDPHWRSQGAPAHGVRAAHGPPPHAPAHGYRHKLNHHGGVQIAFDSGIGVYVVAGHTNLFFLDDHFYRWHNDGWQSSARLDRGWISIGTAKLPGHLAKKHAGKRHGHSPKHHPAKRKH